MKIQIMLIIIVCLAVNSVVAVPPHPERQERSYFKKSSGELCNEFGEVYEEWKAKGIDEPSDIEFNFNAGEVDTFYMLAILVEFSDKQSQTSEEFFDSLIYLDEQNSVRDYFLENSYGKLNITTITLPSEITWLSTQKPLSEYTSGGAYGLGAYPNNAQKLVEDAIDLADPVVDFSRFDNDDDGFVDGLIIVHAGRGAEYTMKTTDIWSHKWRISSHQKDGVKITDYTMMPEYWLRPGDMTIGVFAHELGHVFGLPELYDRDYSSRGAGRYSVMSSGSWNGTNGDSPSHFDAWSKIQLGFVEAVNVTEEISGAEIPDVETNDVIYKLWTDGEDSDEYFLVENRYSIGYDSELPSHGLLIWHIDDGVSTYNDKEWYPEHTDNGHYRIALEQADGLFDLENKENHGDGGDPFPGITSNTSFNPFSTPGSNAYDGSDTRVAVTNISEPGSLMSADLSVVYDEPEDDLQTQEEDNELVPDEFMLAQNYPNPFNSGTTISFSIVEPSHVEIVVHNVLGQTVTVLTDDYYETGTYQIYWNGGNTDGRVVSSGVYFYIITTDDTTSSRKMTLLK